MTSLTESKNNAIGVIGVGVMGRCMVEFLQKGGFSVVAYDPSPAAQEFIREKKAVLAESAAAVAERVQLVIMSLPTHSHVMETVNSISAKLTNGHVVVDTSTVSPETSKEAAKIASQKGAGYVDAPILGRPSAAGNWLLPSGGDEAHIEFARPALETFAKRAVRVGDIGAGNALKLLNQLMFSVINGISAEVMALTDALGVDKKVFYDVIANSGAATVSGLFKEAAGRMVDDNYESPVFTMELLCKDAGLGIQMAKEAGVMPLIAGFVQNININAGGKGLAKQDTSSLVKLFREYFRKGSLK